MLSTKDVEAGVSFGGGLCPEGTYKFIVKEGAVKTSASSGNKYIMLKNEVTDGENKGKTVYHNLTFTDKTAVGSLGVIKTVAKKDVSFDPDSESDLAGISDLLSGKKFVGRVRHEENTYNGQTRTRAVFGELSSAGPVGPELGDDFGGDDDSEIPF